MGLVATEDLTTGMVLAGEVFDRSGRLLLGAGIELTCEVAPIIETGV